MTPRRKRWLQRILTQSSRIYAEKERLFFDTLGGTFLRVFKIFFLELELMAISLPAYLLVRQDDLVVGFEGKPDEIIRFRLRRGFATGLLGLLVIVPIVTAPNGVITTLLSSRAGSEEYESSWVFTNDTTTTYAYDSQKIQIAENVASFKPFTEPETVPQNPPASDTTSFETTTTSLNKNIIPTEDTTTPPERIPASNQTPSESPSSSSENSTTTSWINHIISPALADETSLTSSTFTTSSCSARLQPIDPITIDGFTGLKNFSEVANKPGGEIYYQISFDNGLNWFSWKGNSWQATTENSLDYFSTARDIQTHLKDLSAFTPKTAQVVFRAIFTSDCHSNIQLSSVTIDFLRTVKPATAEKTLLPLDCSAIIPIGSPEFHILGREEKKQYYERHQECFKSTPAPGRFKISSDNTDILLTNDFGESATATDRGVYVYDKGKSVAYLGLADNLDLSSTVLGADDRRSWLHLTTSTRSILTTVELLIPRSPHDTEVVVCPGAQSAEEIYDGCPRQIVLKPENPESNGYSLSGLDDQSFWHVSADPNLFSTGGMGSSGTIISQWHFNETSGCAAADAYGLNNGLFEPSCPTDSPTTTAGHIDAALFFNGTTQYVSVTNSQQLWLSNHFSLSAWVKPSALQPLQRIISKPNAYELSEGSTTGSIRFSFYDQLSGWQSVETPLPILTTSTWHFIAATYDGSVLRIYNDGVLITSSGVSGTVASSTDNLFIGAGAGPGNYWHGSLDEVSVWDTTLQSNEVAALFTSGASSPPRLTFLNSVQHKDTGRVYLSYSLADAESDTIALPTYEFSTSGAFQGEQASTTFAVTDPLNQGVNSLSSSPSGTNHSLVWDADADLGIGYTGTVFMRFQAYDGIHLSHYVTTSVNVGYWQVDQSAPSGHDHDCTILIRRCPTLQAAVTASSPGDTIRVLTGTYSEAVTIPKNITLLGVGNPIVTSLTLTNGARVASSSTLSVSTVFINQLGSQGTTISDALLLVAPGGTIDIASGTYAENISVFKPVTLRGPFAGIDGASPSRSVGEALLVPGSNDSGGGVHITVATSSVYFDGLTLDGDNPGLAGGTPMNGADSNAAYGIYADTVKNIQIRNTIFKEFTIFAVLFVETNGPLANSIDHCKFDNFPANAVFSSPRVVALLNNSYTNITHNTFTRVSVGVYTQNFTNAGPSTTISYNSISSYRSGIWHNLQAFNASPININSNYLTKEPGSTNNYAIWIMSLQGTTSVVIQNNIISSTFAGYVLWNNPTSNTMTIEGGITRGATYGVWATNYVSPSFAGASTSTYNVEGMTIVSSASSAIFVDRNPLNQNSVTLQAHLNTFVHNTGGFITNGTTLLNALNNWWGDGNGPSDQKTLPNIPNYNNTGGLGDGVSSYVDYVPFSSTSPLTITASTPINGTLSPQGIITVNPGSNQTFVISPANGFALHDTLVDGNSVGPVSTYTFNDILSSHTISADFLALPTSNPPSPIVTIAAPVSSYSNVGPHAVPSITNLISSTPLLLPPIIITSQQNSPSPLLPSYSSTTIEIALQKNPKKLLKATQQTSAVSRPPTALPLRVSLPKITVSTLIRRPEIVQIHTSSFSNSILFSGNSLPNADIFVYVHSAQVLRYKTRANDQGLWSIRHDQNIATLAPGEHVVYVIAIDRASGTKTLPSLPKHFIVTYNWFAEALDYLNVPMATIAFILGALTTISYFLLHPRRKMIS